MTPIKFFSFLFTLCFAMSADAQMLMDFSTPCGAGIPSEHARAPSTFSAAGALLARGAIDVGCLPDANGLINVLGIGDPMGQSKRMLASQQPFERGWGTTSGIFMFSSASIDQASLPSSVTPSAATTIDTAGINRSNDPIDGINDGAANTEPSVYVIDVDPTSPWQGQLAPIITVANFPGSPGVAMIPLQGAPLRPNTLYAAVSTNRVRASGVPLVRTPAFAALAGDAGSDPATLGSLFGAALADYGTAVSTLRSFSGRGYLSPATEFANIVAITAFRTGDPTMGFTNLVNSVFSDPLITGAMGATGGLNAPLSMTPAPIASHLARQTSAVAPADAGWSLPLWDGRIPNLDHSVSPPAPLSAPGEFNEFCVFASTVTMPIHQVMGNTSPPFSPVLFDGPSGFVWSGARAIAVGQHRAARIYVTIPRTPMPAGGYPVAIFSRAGGGGDVPLVSRGGIGTHPMFDGELPGAGPALELARAGYAAVQVDDPYGGLRRDIATNLFGGTRFAWSIGDEHSKLFEITNMVQTRDSIRQTALDLVTVALKVLPGINSGGFNASACRVRPRATPCTYSQTPMADPAIPSGAGPFSYGGIPATASCPSSGFVAGPAAATFDLRQLAVVGHSVGANVAPLALSALYPPGHAAAGFPIFKRAILSGATGSLLNNVLYKMLDNTPLPLDQIAIDALGIDIQVAGYRSLRSAIESIYVVSHPLAGEQEPQLNLFQMGQEPADPQVYNRLVAQRLLATDINALASTRQDVLTIQGSQDHYIPPPVANASNLALGLDLAIHPEHPAGTTNTWDEDLSLYDDRTGYFPAGGAGAPGKSLFLTPEGPLPLGTQFRTFMPYSSVMSLGGLGVNPSFGRALTPATALPLPQRGRSMLAQYPNAPTVLRRSDGMTSFDPPEPVAAAAAACAMPPLAALCAPVCAAVAWIPFAGEICTAACLTAGALQETLRVAACTTLAVLTAPPGTPGSLAKVIYPGGDYPSYPWQDGHETYFQSSQARHQTQCFLKTSLPLRRSDGSLLVDRPIVVAESSTAQNYGTCCGHGSDVTGRGLFSNCSCVAASVCNAPGFASCCDDGSASAWSAACVTRAASIKASDPSCQD